MEEVGVGLDRALLAVLGAADGEACGGTGHRDAVGLRLGLGLVRLLDLRQVALGVGVEPVERFVRALAESVPVAVDDGALKGDLDVLVEFGDGLDPVVDVLLPLGDRFADGGLAVGVVVVGTALGGSEFGVVEGNGSLLGDGHAGGYRIIARAFEFLLEVGELLVGLPQQAGDALAWTCAAEYS
ncbi:hypothetical protein ABZZ20_01360 [Streptomyces sp. NPDC006430]|uniref:hypothetical protein n=1 Tax=Streptomyces sp. NPDC006430 TaxID=3154299 RepID=UPI0033B4A893